MSNDPLIKLKNVKKYFPIKNGFKVNYLKAVDDVSLSIYEGETVGLVGESGCGKSTLGRLTLRLFDKTDGEVLFNGKNIYDLNPGELTKLRSQMQIIFQDPYACLNPKLRVEDIILEPLKFHGSFTKDEKKEKLKAVMDDVGLNEDLAKRYPHELSGGQQQRVGIARALILKPKFIVCDEPVSALDVSIQAQILNLLNKLKAEYGLTYLFISHNLSVVHHICDRIVVMYLGQIVEVADKEELFNNPLHPYTKALISAVMPVEELNNERIILKGDMPDPIAPPEGCRFKTRCWNKCEDCDFNQNLIEVKKDHWVRCAVLKFRNDH